MMDFGKWAFVNKKLVNFLVWVFIIGGVYAYYEMSKLEDPELKVKQAMVVVTYPGASAYQVELEVVDPLEKAIRQMPDVNYVQSYAYNDMCIVTVELLSTVADDAIEQHWDMLRRKVAAASASFPPGASQAMVKDDFGDVYGMFYAITGDGYSHRELADYAELIKREIGNIEGVSRVDVYGKQKENIVISLMQDRLAHLGVKPAEVLLTLDGQNQTVYSGYYENGTDRIRVTVTDRYETVDDIADLIIQGHEDDQLRLRDIAFVEKEYVTPVRNSMTYDGQPAIGISISTISGTDITKIGRKVEKRLAEIEAAQLPAGIEYHKVFFQPERVTDALGTFLINLIESVLIVIAVLILTMGLRSGIIIGLTLIVIVFGSFVVLYMFDGTLQRVSLGAFILAMGMLVDNAIVIIDGILVDLKSGKPRLAALTDIGRKTAMPLLGATLIAILAFLPIFLSPDTAGIYVRDLFIVMAVSLLLSWILALVYVPLRADRLLKNAGKGSGETDRTALYDNRWYHLLSRMLGFGLRHRMLVVVLMVILLAVSGICYRFLPQSFFPDMEYDQLYMEYKLPEGTNYTQVRKDLDSIQSYLAGRSEVKHVVASTGGTPSRYNLVRSIATPSLSYGELIIDFESPAALVGNLEEIQKDLTSMFPDAYVKLKRYNLMYKKYPIEAQFCGPDPAVLHQLADSARAIMERSGAVRLITTDWEPKVPVLMVNYNQSVARRIGLTRSEVGTSLLSATDGIPVGIFYDGIREMQINVKSVDEKGRPLENLEEATVFSMLPSLNGFDRLTLQKLMTGAIGKEEVLEELMQTIPLKQVANGVTVEWEDPVVARWNGQRAQRVQASPMPGMGTEEARAIVAGEIEAMPLPAGYSLSWIGEKDASDQSMKYLFKNFPLAIILMIVILIMLFRDYKIPVIIFCCILMILIGVIPAVLISGKAFGFVAIVGVLGLIGMMIKNGIVLMDEIQLQISAGKEPTQALIDSSLSRLRPVMMASLTTVLGMIPLLPDAMFGAMAATIMGGLLMGTVITLIVIPVLYALFFHIKNK